MPLPARLAAAAGLAVLAAAAGACATTEPTPFCRRALAANDAFADLDPRDPRAYAEFRRIAAQAPAHLSDDLRTVMDGLATALRDPNALFGDEEGLRAIDAAREEVDTYLAEECGVDDVRDRDENDENDEKDDGDESGEGDGREGRGR